MHIFLLSLWIARLQLCIKDQIVYAGYSFNETSLLHTMRFLAESGLSQFFPRPPEVDREAYVLPTSLHVLL